ncbi:MAG: hypothetical protein KC416_14770, partial [Myxococcales bacterium]|nr:hypothetical protein [Myxococcales bacterium]
LGGAVRGSVFPETLVPLAVGLALVLPLGDLGVAFSEGIGGTAQGRAIRSGAVRGATEGGPVDGRAPAFTAQGAEAASGVPTPSDVPPPQAPEVTSAISIDPAQEPASVQRIMSIEPLATLSAFTRGFSEEFASLREFVASVPLLFVGDERSFSMVKDLAVGIVKSPFIIVGNILGVVRPGATAHERAESLGRVSFDLATVFAGSGLLRKGRRFAARFRYRHYTTPELVQVMLRTPERHVSGSWLSRRRGHFREVQLESALGQRLANQLDVHPSVRIPEERLAHAMIDRGIELGHPYYENGHAAKVDGWTMEVRRADSRHSFLQEPHGRMEVLKPPPQVPLLGNKLEFVNGPLRVIHNYLQRRGWATETVPIEYALTRPSRAGRDVWNGRLGRFRPKADPAVTAGLRRWTEDLDRVDVRSLPDGMGRRAAMNSFVFASQWDDALLRHIAEHQPDLHIRAPRGEPAGLRKPGTVKVLGDRIEVTPGSRAFRIEDDLDLDDAIVVWKDRPAHAEARWGDGVRSWFSERFPTLADLLPARWSASGSPASGPGASGVPIGSVRRP